jgi:GalNAc-alpha-(1->4)-GalNAc-alpha-(1->3)-diNAcBac-PP-undecaprenol alpha-1,4-N-acetyl-D-galactosaminyltransferase
VKSGAAEVDACGGMRPVEECADARLLLVIGSLGGGGAERQLSDMANFWADRGAEVTLATWSGPEIPDHYALHERVSRVWLCGQDKRALRAGVRGMLRLRQLVRTLKPDALLSFIDVSNIYSIVATRGLGVRTVVAERTHPALNRTIGWHWRLLRRLWYAQADVVVAQTEDAARWLRRHCAARVTVIPNSLRDLKLAGGPRETLILGIGRLSAEKGFDVLLRAFAKMAHRFADWRITIIGDGPARDTLVRLRDDLKLSAQVEFCGAVGRVEPWLSRAAILVHPSRREGFPNVVLEALGAGIAVVSSDCRAGPAELIEDGINGRLVRVDDVEGFAAAMTELMLDAAKRARFGQEGRRVRERFSPELIMQKWSVCLWPGHASPNGIALR